MLKDPVCGQRIRRDRAHAHIEYEHVTYYLCCPRCQAEFAAAPKQYARPEFGKRAGRTIDGQPAKQPRAHR
jgi:P-type Cu+ transporter